MKALALLLSALLVLAFTANADARTKRSKKSIKPAAAQVWRGNAPGVRQEPARMIEVRPGLWISSYGCIQDEGYGRYSSCDLNDGLH